MAQPPLSGHVRRIVVIGNTGSGKSTLAAELARCLEIAHVELDALYWGPSWTPVDAEVFRSEVARFDKKSFEQAADAWVIDGNYRAVRDLIWQSADALVWLDYPFLTTFRQLFVRTFGRVFSRRTLWGTNQERLLTQLFSRESIFWWLFTTYRGVRREYAWSIASPEYAHLEIVRLRSPKQTRSWLETGGREPRPE